MPNTFSNGIILKPRIKESFNMVGFSFPTSEDLRNATTYVKNIKDLKP